MTPDDLDAILAGATDPAAATLARALREAWAEQEHLRELVERASAQVHAVAAERDAAEQRANRLALDINVRDAILDRAGAKLGWPSGLSVASYWRDRMEAAVDETAGRISKLENLVAQARESYPRAEVLRMLDAAGVEGVGIVDRVRELVSERDEWKRAAEKREVDGAALSSRLRADKATERQRAERAEQERDAALATVRTLNADIAAAAGELRVPIPTPGSDAARLLRANIILRQERDEARAERRAARLDRDAAEEKLAALRGGR